MEVSDKLIEKILEATSNVLLDQEDVTENKNMKVLAKTYNKLLKVADKEYEHDFPFFELKKKK